MCEFESGEKEEIQKNAFSHKIRFSLMHIGSEVWIKRESFVHKSKKEKKRNAMCYMLFAVRYLLFKAKYCTIGPRLQHSSSASLVPLG